VIGGRRVAATGALVVALAGCQSSVAGQGTPALSPTSAAASAPSLDRPTHPPDSSVAPSTSQGLQFRPVNSSAPSPCGEGEYPDLDGATCYRLGTPILAAGPDVRAAASVSDQGEWQVSISLNPADSARLSAYTGGHVGEQLAIVLDGEVLIAPIVQARVGRSIVISGNLTEAEAKDLAQRIAG
jgi:preprotein translocase subunit SecD